jgi:benzoyl-CoA reductase/2-hydroxyglutaryl-CoA dehydratase subunit BcrC/BadD/HgdB
MSFFENHLAQMNRRIQKIRDNPNPRYLKSNLIRYELQRDFWSSELEAWRKGEPFIYNEGGIPDYLVGAMGVHQIPNTPYADQCFGDEVEKYLKIGWGAGVPDWICDRLAVAVGMVLSGDVPPPKLIVGYASFCDASTQMLHLMGTYFDCPLYIIETPQEYGEDSMNYHTKQLWEVIDLMEQTVPGAKFDEDKLNEDFAKFLKANDIYTQIHRLRRQVPCPLTPRDVMRLPRFGWGDLDRQLQYLSAYKDEMAEKHEMRLRSGFNERLRLAWLVAYPFFYDLGSFLEERGVSVVLLEIASAGYPLKDRGLMGDDKEYGRKLTPLEEFARREVAVPWLGMTDRRIDYLCHCYNELKFDAMVHYVQSGCPVNNATSWLLAEKMKEEFGISSLLLEGRMLDKSAFNQQEFETKLDDFIEVASKHR